LTLGIFTLKGTDSTYSVLQLAS